MRPLRSTARRLSSIQVRNSCLSQTTPVLPRHNAARSAFYPSITLGGSAGWTNSAGAMMINPGKFLASAVGSLTQPLFNRGQVVAQYRIAHAQQEEAALGFQQTLLNAGSEVNDALIAYQTIKIYIDKKFGNKKYIASQNTTPRTKREMWGRQF